MSQQEFEQNDQEVMSLVNKAASKESMDMAAAIEKTINPPAEPVEDRDAGHSAASEEDIEAEQALQDMRKRWRRYTMLCSALIAVGCIVAAVLLVLVMLNPSMLGWVANAGILSLGIIAAMQIERIIRMAGK